MADDETKPDDAAEVTDDSSEASEPKPEVAMSQADFDAIVKRERAKGIAKGKREATSAVKTTTPSEGTAQAPVSAEEFAKLQRQVAFGQAVLGRPEVAHLKPTQLSVLETTFDPDDPGKTLTDAVDLFGTAQPAAKAETKEDASDSQAPSFVEPAYQPGAPQGRALEPALDPLQWSRADINTLKSNGTFLDEVERWRNTLPGGASVFARSRKRK